MFNEILELPVVEAMTGLPRLTIRQLIARNEFPAAVRVGGREVGWRRLDVENWLGRQLEAGREHEVDRLKYSGLVDMADE